MPIAPLAAVLVTLLPSTDVPAIARAYAREAARPLWPGFEPAGIPVLLFDGTDTWLLGHPAPPPEFQACADPAGGAIHRGRHAESRANTAVQIAGVACASLLADLSRGADQLAATAIHEAFHVWQDAHVPGWRANEGDLFVLPFDDPERLAERRIETELLRRALASTGEERARYAWAAASARAGRAERDPGSVAYERGIELREGLAQYVQYLAQEDDAVRVAEAGYAADDLRTRGYATGEAWARLCDACAPGWKGRLSDGVRPALDELLREALAASDDARAPLTLDLSALTARAHADAAALQERRARHRAEFLAAPGWTLELVPEQAVFPSAFDPLNVELVAPGEVLHGRWLRVEWDGGSLEVLDRPCLSVAAGAHPLFEGAARVLVTGLAEEPTPRADADGWSTWTGEGVALRMRAVDVTRDAEGHVVRLVPR